MFALQCYLGALFMLLSAWVRYASTTQGLSRNGSYALIMVGQVRTIIYSPLSFTHSVDFRRFCPTDLSNPRTEVLGSLVQFEGEDDSYYDSINRSVAPRCSIANGQYLCLPANPVGGMLYNANPQTGGLTLLQVQLPS